MSDPESDQLALQDLKKATMSGVRALLLSRIVVDLGGFLATIAIARLLTPEEMGRAAVALVFPMIAVILTFEGFGAALVQRPSITPAHLRTSMAMSLSMGVLLTSALAGFALLWGESVFDDETAALLALVSPVFVIAGFSTNSRAQMQRKLEFALLTKIELAAFVLLTVVGIGSAAGGAGERSLVWGALAGQTLEAVLLCLVVRPPRPKLYGRAVRDIGSYGGFAAASGLTFVLRRNIAYIVLGAGSDPTTTGLFFRAFQLSAENQGKISGIMARVAFPVMSRSSSFEDVSRIRARTVSVNAIVILPLLGILCATAPGLVPLVYGDHWAPAIEATQILCIAGAAFALMSGADVLGLALGHPRAVLGFNLAGAGLTFAAVGATAHLDLETVCWAISLSNLFLLVIAQWWLVAGVARMPFWSLVDDAAPAVLGAALLTAVCLPLYPWLANALPTGLAVLTCSAVGGAVYLVYLRLLFPASLADLFMLARGLRGR